MAYKKSVKTLHAYIKKRLKDNDLSDPGFWVCNTFNYRFYTLFYNYSHIIILH